MATSKPSDVDMAILCRLAMVYRLTTARLESEVVGVTEVAMKRRLDRLVEGKFLGSHNANVRVLPPELPPVLIWRVGDATPNFGSISYHLTSRWESLVPRFERTYSISAKSLSLLALPKRKPYLTGQASHDLGVFRMWQWANRSFPQFEFVGEDIFSPERGTGEIVEDAQLRSNGAIVAAMEFGGAYRVERVSEIHEALAIAQTTYVLY